MDRESKPTLILQIVATDRGNPSRISRPVEIEINVQDLNDNDPMFTDSIQPKIKENVRRGTLVFTSVVTDRDAGMNILINMSKSKI